jgi:hypothetical protein
MYDAYPPKNSIPVYLLPPKKEGSDCQYYAVVYKNGNDLNNIALISSDLSAPESFRRMTDQNTVLFKKIPENVFKGIEKVWDTLPKNPKERLILWVNSKYLKELIEPLNTKIFRIRPQPTKTRELAYLVPLA